jgi:hypothetical protein
MPLGQGLVSECRVDVEHLLDRGYVSVGLPQMMEEPDPEDGEGGVVLVRVSPDARCMPDRETRDALGVGQVVRLVQDLPGEAEVCLVTEIPSLPGLLHHSQAVGEV